MSKAIREFVDTGKDAPKPDLPFKERDAITAIVRDPETGKYLGLQWNKIDWETFITGGIEGGQTAEEAACAEVFEETGYKNLRLVCELPRYDAKFFHGPKGENRHARFRCFLFEVNDTPEKPTDSELAKHKPVWLDSDELKSFRLPEGHRYLLNYIQDNKL
jgi:8-oxo-dGTP pyrophosphatase MutT (NUDIX family)